jgi:hypothetical protein
MNKSAIMAIGIIAYFKYFKESLKSIAFENGMGSNCFDLWFILASNNSDCCASFARSNKLVSLSPI